MLSAEVGRGSGAGVQGPGDDNKDLARARDAAYRLLTYRPRSEMELRSKLREKKYEDAVVSRVLSDLTRLGYVNDRQFAREWAAGRVRLRGFGRRRIERELREKGIDGDLIQETVSEVFGDSPEGDVAQREAEKKLRGLMRFEPLVRRRRLAGFLERKGYSSGVIYDVLRKIDCS